MQSIRCIQSEQNKTGQVVYAVTLDDGRTVAELPRSALTSYAGFQVALALRGVHVRLAEVEVLPRSMRRDRWLAIMAAAVAAVLAVAGPASQPVPTSRRTRRR
jgi:hypothetical protein